MRVDDGERKKQKLEPVKRKKKWPAKGTRGNKTFLDQKIYFHIFFYNILPQYSYIFLSIHYLFIIISIYSKSNTKSVSNYKKYVLKYIFYLKQLIC